MISFCLSLLLLKCLSVVYYDDYVVLLGKFLSKTLLTIDDGQWISQLVVEATRYLPTYNHSLEEKVSIGNVKLLLCSGYTFEVYGLYKAKLECALKIFTSYF